MLYIGCPMWSYKSWVGTFFPAHTPASEFLRIYSKQLTTVEGNTTFYALPSIETVRRWAQETPETFRFCPKISRSISHEPGLAHKKSQTLAFVERMRLLNSRLGPIFLQLPPAFAPSQLSELEAFLQFWPQELQLAVEVRHPDFFSSPHAQTLDALLTQYHAARVLMDTRPIRVGTTQEQQILQARERKPNLPYYTAVTGDFAFVRYIGHPRMEENEPFLQSWAQQLGAWLTQGLTLYVFCHCPYEEHSPEICAALYQRIRKVAPLPPLAWAPASSESRPQQGRLF